MKKKIITILFSILFSIFFAHTLLASYINELSLLGINCNHCEKEIKESEYQNLINFVTTLQVAMTPLQMGTVNLYVFPNSVPMNNFTFMELGLETFQQPFSEENLAIWQHEFFHNYFSTTLFKLNNNYRSFYNKQHRLREITYQFDRVSEDEQKEMMVEHKNIIKSRSNLEKKFKKLMAPYDELFADTGAVLISHNPKAIFNAITQRNEYDYFRDFSSNIGLEETILNLKELSNHTIFGNIRSFLWNNYLEKEEVVSNPGIFSSCLLNAINKNVTNRIMNNELSITENNIKKILSKFKKDLELELNSCVY